MTDAIAEPPAETPAQTPAETPEERASYFRAIVHDRYAGWCLNDRRCIRLGRRGHVVDEHG